MESTETEPHVVISDFGLAMFVSTIKKGFAGAASSNAFSSDVGTELYMAPEVESEDDRLVKYDEKVDVFSLGLMMLEVFFGVRIDSLRKTTFDEVRHGVLPRILDPPTPFSTLVRSTLSQKPTDRPSSRELRNSWLYLQYYLRTLSITIQLDPEHNLPKLRMAQYTTIPFMKSQYDRLLQALGVLFQMKQDESTRNFVPTIDEYKDISKNFNQPQYSSMRIHDKTCFICLMDSSCEMLRAINSSYTDSQALYRSAAYTISLLRAAATLISRFAQTAVPKRQPHSLFQVCLERVNFLVGQNTLYIDTYFVKRLKNGQTLATFFAILPFRVLFNFFKIHSPLMARFFDISSTINHIYEIFKQLKYALLADPSLPMLDLIKQPFELLQKLSLNTLSGNSRQDSLERLAANVSNLLSELYNTYKCSKSIFKLYYSTSSFDLSLYKFQRFVINHFLQIAEMSCFTLVAAAKSPCFPDGDFNIFNLYHDHRLCWHSICLLIRLGCLVGNPFILDRLLEPLDLLLREAESGDAIILLERERYDFVMGKLKLVQNIHIFLGNVDILTGCTIYNGKTLTCLLQRLLRLYYALSRTKQSVDLLAKSAISTSNVCHHKYLILSLSEITAKLEDITVVLHKVQFETERVFDCLFGENLCYLFKKYNSHFALNIEHFHELKESELNGLHGVDSTRELSTSLAIIESPKHKRKDELVLIFLLISIFSF